MFALDCFFELRGRILAMALYLAAGVALGLPISKAYPTLLKALEKVILRSCPDPDRRLELSWYIFLRNVRLCALMMVTAGMLTEVFVVINGAVIGMAILAYFPKEKAVLALTGLHGIPELFAVLAAAAASTRLRGAILSYFLPPGCEIALAATTFLYATGLLAISALIEGFITNTLVQALPKSAT